VFRCESNVFSDRFPRLFPWILRGGGRAAFREAGSQQRKNSVCGGTPEFVFALEVVGDQALIGARSSSDFACAGASKPQPGEAIGSRLDDSLSGLFALFRSRTHDMILFT
jgi:hypothetical protein